LRNEHLWSRKLQEGPYTYRWENEWLNVISTVSHTRPKKDNNAAELDQRLTKSANGFRRVKRAAYANSMFYPR